MPKPKDKWQALMILQVLGTGHPIELQGHRIEFPAFDIYNISKEAYEALIKEIAENSYKKLQELLPKK